MSSLRNDGILRLALPKGRMQSAIVELFADAGMPVRLDERGYRPRVPLADVDCKLLKPQNIVEMLAAGSRDVGFAGRDWVVELDADLVELCDTGLDPVRIVAAAPTALLDEGRLPAQPLVVASEYVNLTRRWIEERKLAARFVHTYGATEVFPPDDADVIVDNTATGETLRANGLSIVDELMRSSTCLWASRAALADPRRRARIDDLAMLLRSALDARRRVMLELNCAATALPTLVAALPCMRVPTVSLLHDAAGYAVKAAVPRERLATLIPRLKELGATDLVVTEIAQLIA